MVQKLVALFLMRPKMTNTYRILINLVPFETSFKALLNGNNNTASRKIGMNQNSNNTASGKIGMYHNNSFILEFF